MWSFTKIMKCYEFEKLKSPKCFVFLFYLNQIYLCYTLTKIEYKKIIFRAQKPKAPVTYCDHALSVVCRPFENLHFGLLLQNRLMDFWWNLVWMKYSRSLTSVVVFRPEPSRGGSRAGQKQVIWGPLLQETSSSDQKATATNQMHSNDLEACAKKCCLMLFLVPFQSQIFDAFLISFWT